mgnify:CR=1 FL=1
MSSLRDVAKMAGVSLATASRVANGYAYVQEETRQRVLKVMHDLNYVYTYRQHSRRNVRIGILLPKQIGTNILLHPNVHAVMMGIVTQCNNEHVMNSMVMVDGDSICSEQLFEHPMSAYILLVTSQREEDRLIPLLRARNYPFVIVNRWLDHKYISYVNVDDFGASLNATLRMIDQGHLALGFANGNKELRHSIYRLEGFVAACKQRGIPIHDEWIFHGRYDEQSGYQIAEEIAGFNTRPTLMMTSSDVIAVGLINGLVDHGIRVPEDISVVGYGDATMAAFFRPTLTTVRMPSEQLGMEAVKSCLKLLDNPHIHHIKLAMDCELIERNSTQPVL